MCQAVIVHHEALLDELRELLRRPNAKLRAAIRIDAITNRNDHVEVVIHDLALTFRFPSI